MPEPELQSALEIRSTFVELIFDCAVLCILFLFLHLVVLREDAKTYWRKK